MAAMTTFQMLSGLVGLRGGAENYGLDCHGRMGADPDYGVGCQSTWDEPVKDAAPPAKEASSALPFVVVGGALAAVVVFALNRRRRRGLAGCGCDVIQLAGLGHFVL